MFRDKKYYNLALYINWCTIKSQSCIRWNRITAKFFVKFHPKNVLPSFTHAIWMCAFVCHCELKTYKFIPLASFTHTVHPTLKGCLLHSEKYQSKYTHQSLSVRIKVKGKNTQVLNMNGQIFSYCLLPILLRHSERSPVNSLLPWNPNR